MGGVTEGGRLPWVMTSEKVEKNDAEGPVEGGNTSHCERIVHRGILKTTGLSRRCGNQIGIIGVPRII